MASTKGPKYYFRRGDVKRTYLLEIEGKEREKKTQQKEVDLIITKKQMKRELKVSSVSKG